MAALKSYTVYILLTTALIWNYSAMPSNAKSDCEFDSPMTYDESSELCPNGAKGLKLCEPGQVKIKPCISADEDKTDICEVCPHKFFQTNFNNCAKCHECSKCGMNERVKTVCTSTSNTVCERIFPETITSTASQGSTTKTPSRAAVSTRDSQADESGVVMATCENCETTQSSDKKTIATESEPITPTEIKGSENRAPENGLSHGGVSTIAVVICVVVIPGLLVLVGCFLWKCENVDCVPRNNRNPGGVRQSPSSSADRNSSMHSNRSQQSASVSADQQRHVDNPASSNNGGCNGCAIEGTTYGLQANRTETTSPSSAQGEDDSHETEPFV